MECYGCYHGVLKVRRPDHVSKGVHIHVRMMNDKNAQPPLKKNSEKENGATKPRNKPQIRPREKHG